MIGLSHLKAVHLNDSKNPFASHKDRHEKIGEGSLGLETFRRIVNHPLLKDLPFYLETPNELPGYAAEIRTLRQMVGIRTDIFPEDGPKKEREGTTMQLQVIQMVLPVLIMIGVGYLCKRTQISARRG